MELEFKGLEAMTGVVFEEPVNVYEAKGKKTHSRKKKHMQKQEWQSKYYILRKPPGVSYSQEKGMTGDQGEKLHQHHHVPCQTPMELILWATGISVGIRKTAFYMRYFWENILEVV